MLSDVVPWYLSLVFLFYKNLEGIEMDSILNQAEREWEGLRPIFGAIHKKSKVLISQDISKQIRDYLKSLKEKYNEKIDV